MITELFVVAILVIVIIALFKWNRKLRKDINYLTFSKQSLSTKYGKMSEQFMPFLESYPYDKNNFRFIGTAIDGVQFEDDKIVFVEFKTSNSTMTTKQRAIRNLINDRKIEFKEFRI